MHRGEISLKDRKSSPESPIVWKNLSLSSNLQPVAHVFPPPVAYRTTLSLLFSPPSSPLSVVFWGKKLLTTNISRSCHRLALFVLKARTR